MPTKKNKPGAIIIEGHVQGLSNIRSLGEAGIPVFVVDKTDCIARYSKYCMKFFRCPDYMLDEFADFLIELAISQNIKDWILIPSNDHAVYTISKNKARLEEYFKVLTPVLDLLNKIYDKVKLIEIARQQNVPIPITQLFKSENEALKEGLKFPVVIKGRNGLSFYKAIGKKALVAYNENDLIKQLVFVRNKYQIDKTFTQELIPFNGSNKPISFTALCENGEVKAHWTGIKIREHPIQLGTATFTKSLYNTTCHQQSITLLKALNFTGVCEVEYLRDPHTGEYKLLEINPRTWLWVGLAKACGVDYAKMIYDYFNSEKMNYSQADKTTRYWINPFPDTVYAGLSMLKGQLNPLTYFASLLKGKKVNALFSNNDIKPGLMYFLKIFRFLKNR